MFVAGNDTEGVDRQGPIKAGAAELHQRRKIATCAGVVEHHVQLAKAANRRLHQGAHRVVVGDVGVDVDHILRKPGLQRGAEIVLHVTNRDARTLGDEQFDACQTDTAASAGNHRYLARESSCHFASPLFYH